MTENRTESNRQCSSGMYRSNGSHPVYTDYYWEDCYGYHIATWDGDEMIQMRHLAYPLDLEKLSFESVDFKDVPEELRSLHAGTNKGEK